MIPFDEKNIMNNTIFPPAFGADENMKQGTNDREIRYKTYTARVHNQCGSNAALFRRNRTLPVGYGGALRFIMNIFFTSFAKYNQTKGDEKKLPAKGGLCFEKNIWYFSRQRCCGE